MELKGDRRGLRLLAKGYPDEAALLEDLERTLARQRGFLGQSPLELEVLDRALTPSLLAGAAEVFERFPELDLVSVGRGGLRRPTAVAAAPASGPLLIRTPLRSGQVIEHAGDVVILGDVNPGAEIVASGDIVVMGTLRGVAHAGATGSGEAVVAAFRLQPMQLRVGAVIGRAPDGQAPRPDVPEVARLRDGSLVIERYVPQGGD